MFDKKLVQSLVKYWLMITLSICSIFHLTMIAWDRYEAFRDWIAYKVIVTKSRPQKLALITWLSAIVTVTPLLFIVITGIVSENATIFTVEVFIIVLSVLAMSALAAITYFYIMVKLGVRKRKLSQIRPVIELVNAKLEHRAAMTTALVTIASFLLSPFTMINIL